MSPHIHFPIDAEGYKRFPEVLATVGMRFVERRREAMPAFRYHPELMVIYGELISAQRTYQQCGLRSGGTEYSFIFTMHGDSKTLLMTLKDLERTFAGHLTDVQL